jgi:hypothetical protein
METIFYFFRHGCIDTAGRQIAPAAAVHASRAKSFGGF